MREGFFCTLSILCVILKSFCIVMMLASITIKHNYPYDMSDNVRVILKQNDYYIAE